MKILAWVIAVVFACGVLVAACVAFVNDEDSLAPVPLRLVSHEYDEGGGDCYGRDCGADDYDNRGEDNRRGGISPGPFDRSPVDFRDNRVVICFPFSNCRGEDDGRTEDPVRPMSLFPPTPDGIREFVTNTIMSSIELGRLFADTTITFVSNLLVGIA